MRTGYLSPDHPYFCTSDLSMGAVDISDLFPQIKAISIHGQTELAKGED